MLRQVLKIIFLAVLITGGAYALYRYERSHSIQAKLEEQVRQLEEQKKHLQSFISRLGSERRMAEIIVLDQERNDGQIESTTLLFVELTRDGQRMPPKFFTLKGHIAHIDAMRITFDRGYIEKDDPFRGHSIALFYRLYGDYLAPSEGFRIDEPGKSPEIYRPDPTVPPAVQEFEAELWRDFWKLAEDPKYRQEKGVSYAQGDGIWMPFYPDYVYTITIKADAGLNIVNRPMDPLFREYRDAVLRQRGG